jgi:uncharacterized ferritin-like protein (DUF455 family)
MQFETLQKKSKELQARLNRMADEFPWENKEAYAGILAQSYEYVSFSTRILALTAGHFPLDKTPYSARFIQHAAEEKGHDRLLVNDVKALGYDMAKIPILPEAEAFHKSLYFWIYQGRPLVIFGWILALECFAVQNGPAIFARVEKAHGKKAASFLHVHSNEDPDHVTKAFETIRALSEKELEDVAHGLELYGALYENVYRAVMQQASGRVVKLAA